MRRYGELTELETLSFRANSQNITIQPNASTTYTADRTISLPNADSAQELVGTTAAQTLSNKTLSSPVLTTPQINDNSVDHQYIFAVSELAADRTITLPLLTGNDEFTFNAHTQTLTNKTLTSPTINGGSITGLSSISINDNGSNDLILASSDGSFAADRTLSIDLTDADRSIDLTGDLTLANDFTVTGGGATALTNNGGATNVTLPNSGTLATLTGSETLTNKTLTTPVITINEDELTFNDVDASDQWKFTASLSGGNAVYTLPTATTTLVGTDSTQTLTNKTLTSATLSSPVLTAPQINDTSADHQYVFAVSELAADRTVTLPLLTGNDEFTFNAHTQTLTNKTLTDPQIDAALVFDQISTPSNPSSGDNKLYFKNDNKLYKLDSSGNEIEVGSGSGSGGINYIEDTDAESGVGDWTAYADAAATTPADGTGGSANVTITQNSSSPLRGSNDFLITKDAADRQGEGVSYAFTTDRADDSVPLKISFDYDGSLDADYASDDIKVFIYDVTNTTLITPAGDNGLKAAKTRFETTFNATTSNSYRLIFHVTTTNAAAYTLSFDNVRVGPQDVVIGVPIEGGTTADISTSNFTNDTALTIEGRFTWKRIGDDLHCTILFNVTGGSNGTDASALTFNPSTISGFPSITFPAGEYGAGASRQDNGTTTDRIPQNFFFIADGTGGLTFARDSSEGALNGDDFGDASNKVDEFSITAIIPVNEWAGSAAYLSQARPEYASNSSSTDGDDTSSFVYGPQGAQGHFGVQNFTASRNKRVRFLTPIQPTDRIVVQVMRSGSGVWVDAADGSQDNAQATVIDPIDKDGDSGFGTISPVSGSDTDIDVRFERYRTGTSGWSTVETTARWRVVKIPGQIQVAEAAEYMELDISGENSEFSAAQPVLKLYKRGRQVTLTWGDLAHTSTPHPSTTAGFIPAGYRPSFNVGACYGFGAGSINSIEVQTDGTLQFQYRDYAGTQANRTSTLNGSIVWLID